MLAQKIILSYGSKLSTQFIQIVASIIVARVAGATVLGTVSFGMAFVYVFLFLADLGTGTAHVKLISEGADLGKCVGTFTRLKLALTALFFVAVLAVFAGQKYILRIPFESPIHQYVILIFLAAAVLEQVVEIPKRTFMARTEQAKTDIPQIAREFLYQVLRIVVVYLGYRAIALALGNLFSLLIVLPLVWYLFKDYPRGSFDKALALKYIRMSLPVLVIGLSTTVISQIDRIVLQYFTSSEQVGIYTAGYRVGSLVLMVANAVGVLLFPYFSRASSNGDFHFIKKKIDKFEKFSFLFIMPGVIFLSLYSDVIIKILLGEQYLASIPVMMIINIAMFISVVNLPYGNVITGMGFFKLAAWINIIGLFIFVAFLVTLPNPNLFGMSAVGVALAVLLLQVFIGVVFRIYAKKKCTLLDMTTPLKFIIFGAANFLGFLFLYEYLSGIYGFRFKLVFIPLYFGVTYLSFILLGWIHKDDLESVRTVVDVKKLFAYIRGEMRKKHDGR
jgi:O-antigen/teichoic acid export membrane protein